MQGKMTKTNQVKNHLINNGSITSWEAIENYKATRLSAIIFVLKERGMDIDTEIIHQKDSNGNPTSFAKYILKGEA